MRSILPTHSGTDKMNWLNDSQEYIPPVVRAQLICQTEINQTSKYPLCDFLKNAVIRKNF